ncbi:YgjP-like metallopeptidase domain-containing protein [Streptomyces sp. CC224B]|uniref:M48 family metallopeptidase n=1 Tax=Streptomyces sp. CC224B TaxID=3044571 RepID=UPI0024A8E6F3|nr:YgjP-like metallopeptidase domain-containing protein [Streptomyces sp. CC224B]
MNASVESAIAALPLPAEWQWQVVVRPRRRTLGIEVAEDGALLFAVPADAEPAAVADAVRARLPRLAAEVRRRETRAGPPVKELVSGASFAYLGRRYRLRVLPDGGARKVRLQHGWLELPRTGTRPEGAQLLTDWYQTRGSRWLTARAIPLAMRAGVRPAAVEARELGERWGLCRSDGRIALHWALMQLPPALLDVVLVHELVHLKTGGHGAAFRRAMRVALPDVEVLERLFAEAEPTLWRGAVG